MTQNILIIGATSAIAEAVAHHYAKAGANLFLVGRDQQKLKTVAANLQARGAKSTHCATADANDYLALEEAIETAWSQMGAVDVALIAHGTLPDQGRCEADLSYAIQEFRNNGETAIACLTLLANRLEPQKKGVLAVISSVAGDRGRPSNYLYGSAKAAVDAFASGLRGRLFKSGVQVLIIKPGFVATPMTANLRLPEKLTATADKVAGDIVKAIRRRKDVVYTPGFWVWIMLVVRNVPGVIFNRMSI
jgi:decaprenylphospho-beta-D-erythro-pentofuranosid-2-ulose 2-reductase